MTLIDHYEPMIDALKNVFGVEFELWDTGGGCQALVAEFEGDITVYITDAPGSPFGEECQITGQTMRELLGEKSVGFAVGVYRDEHQTQVAYREYPRATTKDLPALVREQLNVAQTT